MPFPFLNTESVSKKQMDASNYCAWGEVSGGLTKNHPSHYRSVFLSSSHGLKKRFHIPALHPKPIHQSITHEAKLSRAWNKFSWLYRSIETMEFLFSVRPSSYRLHRSTPNNHKYRKSSYQYAQQKCSPKHLKCRTKNCSAGTRSK